MLAQLQEMHPDEIQLVYRHFPLIPIHDKASLAGQSAEAAGEQGAFWPMHDLLFDRHEEWINLDIDSFTDWLIEGAQEMGLEVEQFRAALESGRYAEEMTEAFQQGVASGIPGTPFIFLNGELLRISPRLRNLEALVRLILLQKRQYDRYPAMSLAPGANYQARIRLSPGELLVRLFPDTAPLGVNSFIFLSQESWYDNNPIYRVAPGSMVETGDPTGTGHGEAGFYFQTEIDPATTFDQAGMVALSSSGPNISGSRFFITLAPMPELNGTRTIIGQVVSGLNLLQSLSARDPLDDLLTPPEGVITSIIIEGE